MSELRESGLIRLAPRLGRTGAWILPIWAVLCGAVASAHLHLSIGDIVRIALSVLLVEGGWGTLWGALGTTDWATLFQQWRNWTSLRPVPSLPYTQPGSPAERLTSWLSRLRSWWQAVLLPNAGPALGGTLVGLAVSLLVAFALGPQPLLLTLAVLALMELAVLARRGQTPPSGGWDGVLRGGGGWLAGHVALASLTLPSVALAGAFSLAAAGVGNRSRTTWIGGQALAVLLLIFLHRPLSASVIALLLIPQWLLLSSPSPPDSVHQRALAWLAVAMFLAAWAV